MTAISGLPAAAALDGTELVETVQAGANVQTTTQAIADLTPTGGGGGGEVRLVDVNYEPATLDTNTCSSTAATYTPLDATNLATPAFVVPASGAVRHIIDCTVAGQNWNYIGLLSSGVAGVPLVGSTRRFSLGTLTIPFHYEWDETGLVPGASVTRWVGGRVAGNSYSIFAGGDYGPFQWRVIEL